METMELEQQPVESAPAVEGAAPLAPAEVGEAEAAEADGEAAAEDVVPLSSEDGTSGDATATTAAEEATTEAAQPDWEALLAEAEERGYRRGRNENIAQLMERPGVFERLATGVREADGADTGRVEILTRERRSIWDL